MSQPVVVSIVGVGPRNLEKFAISRERHIIFTFSSIYEVCIECGYIERGLQIAPSQIKQTIPKLSGLKNFALFHSGFL